MGHVSGRASWLEITPGKEGNLMITTPKPWQLRHITRQDGSGGYKRFQIMGKVGGMDFEIARGNEFTDVQEANARLIVQSPVMVDHLKYIEYAISVYSLESVADDAILCISISGKAAKDIVSTITDIIT